MSEVDILLKKSLEDHLNLVKTLSESQDFFDNIKKIIEVVWNALQDKRKIIICGNGGSMAQSIHLAEELTGRFRHERPPIAAIALSDPGHISCVGNDYGFEYIFSRMVESIGNHGDILILLTTSGMSQNLIEAALSARNKGILTIGFTGKSGGTLAPLLNYELRVPYEGFSDRIQEIHTLCLHLLVEGVEYKYFAMGNQLNS